MNQNQTKSKPKTVPKLEASSDRCAPSCCVSFDAAKDPLKEVPNVGDLVLAHTKGLAWDILWFGFDGKWRRHGNIQVNRWDIYWWVPLPKPPIRPHNATEHTSQTNNEPNQ